MLSVYNNILISVMCVNMEWYWVWCGLRSKIDGPGCGGVGCSVIYEVVDNLVWSGYRENSVKILIE
jgi:hypothetical protein